MLRLARALTIPREMLCHESEKFGSRVKAVVAGSQDGCIIELQLGDSRVSQETVKDPTLSTTHPPEDLGLSAEAQGL